MTTIIVFSNVSVSAPALNHFELLVTSMTVDKFLFIIDDHGVIINATSHRKDLSIDQDFHFVVVVVLFLALEAIFCIEKMRLIQKGS